MKSSSKIAIIIVSVIAVLTAVCGGICFFSLHQNPTSNSEQATDIVNIPGNTPPYHFDYSWANHPYVAHAMGGILGDTYTNSYEAFLLNYQLGHRIFEVDFVLTTDGETVAEHDGPAWHEHTTDTEHLEFNHDNFITHLAYDKYHRLDATDVIELMQAYPDIYIVTDSKFADAERVNAQFTRFVELAKAIDPSILDRIIIQIYRPEMLDLVMAIHPWRSIIYTLYANPDWTPENVLAFSEQTGVKFITMWHYLVTPEIVSLWDTADIKIAAHTVNDLAAANRLRDLGTDVIYTDFLIP